MSSEGLGRGNEGRKQGHIIDLRYERVHGSKSSSSQSREQVRLTGFNAWRVRVEMMTE